MGETEEFNTLAFEKRLMQLKDTQESIQGLSSWCLRQKAHHKKIVCSWLNVLKRVKVEQRLVLFYLANDVIQYSKRKNYDFVESWGHNLQKATPLVRDEKVKHKILRIFKIWEQRSVYDDEFLSDLTGLLSAGAIKKSDDDSEFQPTQLVNKIKQCSVLEADTDLRLKDIHDNHLELSDAELLRTSLKGLYEERGNKDDVEKELNDGIACVERYTAALQREIVAREALLALLKSANQYYSTQRGEVKVVAFAYKTFGARVRALKRKLDELITTLPNAAPSPPQRDEDVPSPGPDEDLDLPAPTETTEDDDIAYNIDQTFNSSIAADGSLYNLGLTSFLSSDNPMALFDSSDMLNSTNKIEVINSRPNDKQDFNINDVLKNLMSNDTNTNASDNISNNSVTSASISQKSQDTLPGLDLLTPDTPGNPPPPTSFYGTMDLTDEPEPYHPEPTSPWSSNWNVPRGVAPLSAAVFADTPESPPPAPRPLAVPEPVRYPHVKEIPAADVDQRGILPPPPPPPALPTLGQLEDVDHRMLPTLPTLPPPPPPVTSTPVRHPVVHQDVDHRNLIPLTHQPSIPRPMNPISLDQDYRVPPLVLPTDIVESVDMDLSEDEEQQGMYPSQQNQPERRHSFNNNKVLVGGDNGKVHNDHNHTNLIQINSDKKEPHSAPIMPPMVNPFDAMPPSLKNFNMNYQNPPNTVNTFDLTEETSNDSAYEEDLRNRGLEKVPHQDIRNPSPPFEDFTADGWQQPPPRHMNPRYPRNWGPRTNFRPPGFAPPQPWPRNGPRPPNRWMGPRPRFW